MHIVLSIVAIVVVIVGVAYARLTTNSEVPKQTVLNASDENIDSSTPTPTQQITTSKPKPTASSSITPKPTPTPTINQPEFDLSEFIYPGSAISEQTGVRVKLTTGANPADVTNWYKAKIKAMDMNVTSFVTTKSNDVTLNKLAGANSSFSVSVEIKQDGAGAQTQVTVERDK